MGGFLENKLNLRINHICYLLEHDKYLTKIRREHIKKELNDLIYKRDMLREHINKRKKNQYFKLQTM